MRDHHPLVWGDLYLAYPRVVWLGIAVLMASTVVIGIGNSRA